MISVTILGLGEAGRLYARGLRRAGARVRGFDPYAEVDDSEFPLRRDIHKAVRGADVVLSLVGGRSAVDAATLAMPELTGTAVYAEMNSTSPETKQHVAAIGAEAGIRVADVAVLAPVTRAGHRTALLASGEGADDFAVRLEPLGVPIEVVPGGVGKAAQLRLLRSVFMKGLAALVIEGLDAARATGADEWLRGQIESELGPDGPALVERLVTGTRVHARRRELEVREALDALEAQGQPADMTRATLVFLERIVAASDDHH